MPRQRSMTSTTTLRVLFCSSHEPSPFYFTWNYNFIFFSKPFLSPHPVSFWNDIQNPCLSCHAIAAGAASVSSSLSLLLLWHEAAPSHLLIPHQPCCDICLFLPKGPNHLLWYSIEELGGKMSVAVQAVRWDDMCLGFQNIWMAGWITFRVVKYQWKIE